MHGLRWIEGRGLFAEAELTERARALVQSGEYRYFSPVFEYARGSGEVTRILMGALTNHPRHCWHGGRQFDGRRQRPLYHHPHHLHQGK